MIYISNKKFLKEYLLNTFSNVDLLYEILLKVYYILRYFWKKIKVSDFVNLFKDLDEDVYEFLMFLNKFWKLNVKDVKELLFILEKENKITPRFDVWIIDEDKFDQVVNILKNKFGENIKVDLEKIEELWLIVKGNGRYYKRTLKTDLDKLL